MVKIIREKCINCNICKEKCPFGAIENKDNRLEINENCKECMICLKNCPQKAIIQEKIDKIDKKLEDFKGVYIFGELEEDKLHNATYELLTKGGELAEKLEENLGLIIIGNVCDEEKNKLMEYGIDDIYLFNINDKNYDCKTYSNCLKNFVEKNKPNILLFSATSMGRELAPYLASQCETGITADCTKLDIDESNKLLKQTRPTFGGKMLATITMPNHRPQICTVRPGVFEEVRLTEKKAAKYIKENVVFNKNENKEILKKINKVKRDSELENAEIIVAGGMGLGKKEGFDLIKKLANSLNGQIATTRACVEEGWIDSKYQIGQTGINVSPKIYIACGISGAIQHVAGVKNANYIIAINKDKNAPIFEIADYGIIGDLYEVILRIIEKIGGKE
jgi:electron transfer flavoprotein alpha subunit/NAD-dependent dihydropyrimidine dehydrogenase PreA subunit